MGTGVPAEELGPRLRARKFAVPVLVWSVWLAMSVASMLFIRQNARNIPYMDDFWLVPMMTGNEKVDLSWAWAQHNEHRPFISRLILAGTSRFISNDFRAGMYINAGLMSAGAASMLVLARRMRGRTAVTDLALPLAILSLAQAEVYLIGFALNLVLTTWIGIELIAAADLAGRRPGWRPALKYGLCLVLLPLCGASGLVMLPPLALWLVGYAGWNCWSGRRSGRASRAIGLSLALLCTVIVGLYMRGYSRPGHHPPPPSIGAAASTTMEFLSLVILKSQSSWRPVSWFVALLVAGTLLRLLVVTVRVPEERPRATGLIAIILAMLAVAVAVGTSRSGFGPGMGLTSRYVTTAAPLLAALYIAWLAYGPPITRMAIHTSLLILVCLGVPGNNKYGLILGRNRRAMNLQVERGLEARMPASKLMTKVSPALYPDAVFAYDCLRMLKAARVGKFENFVDDRVAEAPSAKAVVR